MGDAARKLQATVVGLTIDLTGADQTTGVAGIGRLRSGDVEHGRLPTGGGRLALDAHLVLFAAQGRQSLSCIRVAGLVGCDLEFNTFAMLIASAALLLLLGKSMGGLRKAGRLD